MMVCGASTVAGFLSVELAGGVLYTRLTVGLDFGLLAKRGEPVRIDDHQLDGNPLRAKLRKLLLGEIKPLIERLGEIIDIVHYGPDAIVIFTSIPGRGKADRRHRSNSPQEPSIGRSAFR